MINAVTNSTVPHLTVIIGVVLRRRHLRHVGPGVRQPLHVPLAHRQDRRHGPEADRRRDVDRAPGPGRPQGRAVRRGGGRARSSRWSRRSRRRARSRCEATGAISDDGIIDPRDTRTVLGMCLSVVRNRADRRRRGLRGVPAVSARPIAPARRQPRRDRPAHHPQRPGDGHALRRRLRRRRRRTRRSSPRPTRRCASPTGYLDGEAILAAAARDRRRRRPPRLRLPVRERRVRRGRGRRRAGLGRARRPRSIEAMGDKLAAKRAGRRGRRADAAVHRRPDRRRRGRLPAARQGGRRRRRQGHARRRPTPAISPRRSPPRGARRRAASATTGCSSSATSPAPATSRSRSWATRTAASSTSASASARSSAATRRSSRSRRRRVVDDALRDAMGEAALRLARAIGYQSAGTVEFLVDDDTGEFFFLEVNTRLQVEHPVTEAVTGIDLVREQLRVAAGEPLGYDQARRHASPGTRSRPGSTPRTRRPASCRPRARSPRSRQPPTPAVRWDSGVEPGSVVGVDFDPMLAKVIAHAPTRARGRRSAGAGARAAPPRRRHHEPRLPRGDLRTPRSWPATRPPTSSNASARRARSRSTTTSSSARATAAALWMQGAQPRRRTGARHARRAAGATPACPAQRVDAAPRRPRASRSATARRATARFRRRRRQRRARVHALDRRRASTSRSTAGGAAHAITARRRPRSSSTVPRGTVELSTCVPRFALPGAAERRRRVRRADAGHGARRARRRWATRCAPARPWSCSRR